MSIFRRVFPAKEVILDLPKTPEEIIKNTLKHEGGWSKHPKDPGGSTNYGITLKTYRGIFPKATEADLHMMTREDAIIFYKAHIWRSARPERIPEGIRDVWFDMVVNHGIINANILLQRALRVIDPSIADDGVIGPKTRETMTNIKDIQKVRDAIILERERFYRRIVERKPSQKVFLKGWLNRNNSFKGKVN